MSTTVMHGTGALLAARRGHLSVTASNSNQASSRDNLGENGVGEERVPVLGAAVGRGDGGAQPNAFADELVEVLGLLGGEVAHGEVVHLLRHRSKWTYPDLAIIPMSRVGRTEPVHGGGLLEGVIVGIITGPRGRPAACPGVDSGPASRRLTACGRGPAP